MKALINSPDLAISSASKYEGAFTPGRVKELKHRGFLSLGF